MFAGAASVGAARDSWQDVAPPAVGDRQAALAPDVVHLEGWIGSRIAANEANRLVKIDTDRLLEGYRRRPGRQAWDGEHVGKWLHAATLAWVYTGDAALRRKLDATAAELVRCQLADGYLGTYLPKDRWTEWDVWAHKYNLIGLLTYMRYTGETGPMAACRRMGDLLCRELGNGPGQLDIIKAGTQHVGMASTSVLEAMVLLHRMTGEPRYLQFCRYIVRAWEQPNGPRLMSHLLARHGVNQVGNGKGYEMLSCLNGALELYRTTGDRDLLTAAVNAWEDIVAHRLYLTGAATAGELFHADHLLPNVHNVGETCVTVTWLQLNAQLLRLTGEARYAEQLERVVLNQLLGAQRPDGRGWGYYVQMEGTKPYSDTLDGHCCLSSGPRGMALVPTFAFGTDADGIVVNLFDAGRANLKLSDGTAVGLTLDTLYPASGRIRLKIEPSAARTFGLKLRIPAWCAHYAVRVGGEPVKPRASSDGYIAVERRWQAGDELELEMELRPRVVVGDHVNEGRIAVLYGPLVLTADSGLLGREGGSLNSVAAPGVDVAALQIAPEPAPLLLRTWPGALAFRMQAVLREASGSLPAGSPVPIRLIPFAEAGCTGTNYRLWLPLYRPGVSINLLREGVESRSSSHWVHRYDGLINDGDPATVVDTCDGKLAKEAWFAVTLPEPVKVSRVNFVHGRSDHDGGWFVSAGGRPRVQVLAAPKGEWETVGELADFPATTATSAEGLGNGARFSCDLGAPRRVVGVRVIGQPASGDNPKQSFATCAELEAY